MSVRFSVTITTAFDFERGNDSVLITDLRAVSSVCASGGRKETARE